MKISAGLRKIVSVYQTLSTMSILNPHAPVFVPAMDSHQVQVDSEEVDSQGESLGVNRKMLVIEATDRTKHVPMIGTPYCICNKNTVLYVERFKGGGWQYYGD